MKIIERNIRNENEKFICKSEKAFDAATNAEKMQQITVWGFMGHAYLFYQQELIYVGDTEANKLPRPEVRFDGGDTGIMIVEHHRDTFTLIGGEDGIDLVDVDLEKLKEIDRLNNRHNADMQDYREFKEEGEPKYFLERLREDMKRNIFNRQKIEANLTPVEKYFHRVVQVNKYSDTGYLFEKK